MTPKKAEQILDELGIEYEKVTMGQVLIVKLKDGKRIGFKKLIRMHTMNKLEPTQEIVVEEPTEVTMVEIKFNPATAETDIIPVTPKVSNKKKKSV